MNEITKYNSINTTAMNCNHKNQFFTNNYYKTISFHGATKWLQKTIFTNKDDFKAILNCSNSEIIGYFPKDMINFVIKNSKNKETKNNLY